MGASLDFDGNDDYITLSTDRFNVGRNATLLYWLSLDAYDTSGHIAMSTNTGSSARWGLLSDTSVEIQGRSFTVPSTNFADGNWHHIGMTAKTGTVLLEFYRDGIFHTSSAITPDNLLSGTKTWRFGKWASNNSFDTDGRMAHLSFYDRRLSQAEIIQEMYYPGTIIDGRLLYYDMMGDSSTVLDMSGAGDDGTITGATSSVDGPPVSIGTYGR